MKKTNQSRNATIDTLRFIGGFFVIFLHIHYNNHLEIVDHLRLMSRWAVPYYFIVSGYFFQQNFLKDPLNNTFKNIIKIVSIYVVSSIIYITINYIESKHFFSITSLFIGTYYHLWFLPSMIIGYIYIYTVNTFKINIYIQYSIILIIIITILILDSYSGLFFGRILKVYSYSRLLISIPFMYLGFTIRKNQERIKNHLNKSVGFILLLIGYLIQMLEAKYLLENTHYPIANHIFLIGTIFYTIAILILCVSFQSRDNVLSDYGRRYSLPIYLYHAIPLIFVNKFIISYKLSIAEIIILPLLIQVLMLIILYFIDKYFNKLFNLINGTFK
ncbi:acyltransferase family protein [Siphonobacter curvatus]|uniref:Acyltransferase 3 domain-containing protein n=1 Tax=Siphonobacter curvatus TaxID=2094562 RepID=A0A2S7IES9_9BACT|nr:hypothetical protein C5O19_25735 [Siphonobacter curvatus]